MHHLQSLIHHPNSIIIPLNSNPHFLFNTLNSLSGLLDDNLKAVEYSLEILESVLDPEKFFRINRRFLISLDALDKIYILSKSRIKVELLPPVNDSVYVSASRAHDFRKWLDE